MGINLENIARTAMISGMLLNAQPSAGQNTLDDLSNTESESTQSNADIRREISNYCFLDTNVEDLGHKTMAKVIYKLEVLEGEEDKVESMMIHVAHLLAEYGNNFKDPVKRYAVFNAAHNISLKLCTDQAVSRLDKRFYWKMFQAVEELPSTKTAVEEMFKDFEGRLERRDPEYSITKNGKSFAMEFTEEGRTYKIESKWRMNAYSGRLQVKVPDGRWKHPSLLINISTLDK